MPLIPFPNAPQVPGVPAILRETTIPSVSELVNYGLGALTEILFGVPRWGLYDDSGAPVVVFDSFLGIRFRNGGRVSDFPVEQGGFSSFNKVDTPFDAVIRLAHGGDLASRAAMLATLEQIVHNTDLYSVVTPEIVYPSANLVNYSISRTQRDGSSLLTVELALREIRQTALPEFSATEDPSGAAAVNNGQVQSLPIDNYPARDANATGALRAGIV
jgi:hypothetical protein